jgi:hypothetical protein
MTNGHAVLKWRALATRDTTRHRELLTVRGQRHIVVEPYGVRVFASGPKRESGESPELPRSGKQERKL